MSTSSMPGCIGCWSTRAPIRADRAAESPDIWTSLYRSWRSDGLTGRDLAEIGQIDH
jgi:hypothetical protein